MISLLLASLLLSSESMVSFESAMAADSSFTEFLHQYWYLENLGDL